MSSNEIACEAASAALSEDLSSEAKSFRNANEILQMHLHRSRVMLTESDLVISPNAMFDIDEGQLQQQISTLRTLNATRLQTIHRLAPLHSQQLEDISTRLAKASCLSIGADARWIDPGDLLQEQIGVLIEAGIVERHTDGVKLRVVE